MKMHQFQGSPSEARSKQNGGRCGAAGLIPALEAEAGGLQIQYQAGLYGEIMSRVREGVCVCVYTYTHICIE